MMKVKTMRVFLGFIGFLIILVPFSGFPGQWKDALIVFFGALIILILTHRFVLVEICRLIRDFKDPHKKVEKRTPLRRRRPMAKKLTSSEEKQSDTKKVPVQEDQHTGENNSDGDKDKNGS